jgi:hypothetical protein
MKLSGTNKVLIVQAVGTVAAGALLVAATHQLAMVRFASAAAFGGGGLVTELATQMKASSIRRREAREAREREQSQQKEVNINREPPAPGVDHTSVFDQLTLELGKCLRKSNAVTVSEGFIKGGGSEPEHVAVIQVPPALIQTVVAGTQAQASVFSTNEETVVLTLPWLAYQEQQKAFQATES